MSALAAKDGLDTKDIKKQDVKKPEKRGLVNVYSNTYPGFGGISTYSGLPQTYTGVSSFGGYSGQYDSSVNAYSYEGATGSGVYSNNLYSNVATVPQHTETVVNHPAQTVVNQVDNVVKVPYTVPKPVSVARPVPVVVNNPVPVHVPKAVPVQVGEEHHITQPIHPAPVYTPHQVYGVPVAPVHHPVGEQVSITEHTLPAIRTYPHPASFPFFRAAPALPTYQAPLPASIPTYTASFPPAIPAFRHNVHHVTQQNVPTYVEEHHHQVPVPVATGVAHHTPAHYPVHYPVHHPVYQQQTGVIAHEEIAPAAIQSTIPAFRANYRVAESLPSYASGFIEEQHHHQVPAVQSTEVVQHVPVHHQETVVHTPVHHQETVVHTPAVQQQEIFHQPIVHQPIVHHPTPIYQQTEVVSEEIAPATPVVVDSPVRVATTAPVVATKVIENTIVRNNDGYDYPKPARKLL